MRIVEPVARVFQPLQRKLPLLIAALLCAVVVGFLWLVNRELKGAFESAASQRLSVAAQRLASMFSESSGALRGEMRRLVSDSAITALMTKQDASSITAATALLVQRRPNAGAPPSRAIWTRDCRLLVSTGEFKGTSLLETCPRESPLVDHSPAQGNDWVHPMGAFGKTMVYATVVPIEGAAHDTLGHLVQLRTLTGAATTQLLSSMLGKDATLLFGNARGPVFWTDLSKPTDGPPRSIPPGIATHYTGKDGVEQFGVAQTIASTPWTLWVQMPVATVAASQVDVLRQLAYIALVCIIIGVLGAWALSHHVTRPILELKRAAEDLAGGDYSRRVDVTRNDELGMLMTSFNRMAEQVQAGNEELSAQTEELEHHFTEAQDLARQLEMSNQELIESAELTERAHHERELAQSLLDEVINRAPVGIAVFDAQLRYVRLNPALAAMNGVSIEEHIGRTASAVVPEWGNFAVPHLSSVIQTGATLANKDVNDIMLGGKKRHWLASYFPVRGHRGEVIGAGAMILDTTLHHELEAQLLQAQKMDAVGRLAGGVAHDFNNLLTVISSYSEMALETLAREDPLYADMQEIRSSAERASRLTRQLLAFSRKQVMQPQVLDLNRVATEMERMLRRLIGEDVMLLLDLAPKLGEVCADPGQIEQVLMNLVLNARDAMPEGGRLVIGTSNLSLTSDLALDAETLPAGEYVTLSVDDSGTGMTDETKGHLFEPFFTTKATGQGTGLGLSTVYGIVKQSGGDVVVRSSPGKGSNFMIYLPRHKRQANRTPLNGNKPAGAYGGSETILLVEDDAALRNLARRILKSAGYTVLEARTANTAIELGTNHEGIIHLLLTDVVMPQASGREVGDRLSVLRPDIRVLYMSGYTDDDVMRRGVVSAKTEFLQKPFTPEELIRRIREVLDANIVHAEAV
ncbi:MAG: ATP-binding protein [Gemmatimonadota bacterium]